MRVMAAVKGLYGPPTPHIGFWFYDCYLGEVRYPFTTSDPVGQARNRLAHHIEMLYVGVERDGKLARLYSADCNAKLYRN